jgi:hypothetical protein
MVRAGRDHSKTPIVIPAKAGIPLPSSQPDELIVPVNPVRIVLLDQFDLPGPKPFLDRFLARDGFLDPRIVLGVDESDDAYFAANFEPLPVRF